MLLVTLRLGTCSAEIPPVGRRTCLHFNVMSYGLMPRAYSSACAEHALGSLQSKATKHGAFCSQQVLQHEARQWCVLVLFLLSNFSNMSCSPSSYCLQHAARKLQDRLGSACVTRKCAGMTVRGFCASLYQGCSAFRCQG